MSDYIKFLALHQQAKPLIIANAWNVKSAQLIEKSGFDAIATSSGAISDSLGYKDGENIPFSELLYVIKRIKSSITIPLSVDMERGYASDLATLTDNIQQLIDSGIAGINLEDPEGEEIYLKKLSAIKNYLEKTNQSLFINARIDAFLQKLPSPLEITMKRAKLYKDAGADGLFVTGITDIAIIRQITAATTLPLNIVGQPAFSSMDVLADAGVKRISMAALLYRATYQKMEGIVQSLREGSLMYS